MSFIVIRRRIYGNRAYCIQRHGVSYFCRKGYENVLPETLNYLTTFVGESDCLCGAIIIPLMSQSAAEPSFFL